jgi:hypothetical protein
MCKQFSTCDAQSTQKKYVQIASRNGDQKFRQKPSVTQFNAQRLTSDFRNFFRFLTRSLRSSGRHDAKHRQASHELHANIFRKSTQGISMATNAAIAGLAFHATERL